MNKDKIPFHQRHIGPDEKEISEMLKAVGVQSIEELISKTIPEDISIDNPVEVEPMDELEYGEHIRKIASRNKLLKSYIGYGYYGTEFPAVIQRNILENPSWYTSYTPYQAEISQGRLEALLNFQTAIIDLTGLPIANSSLLDEATSAAEAMLMFYHARSREMVKDGCNRFFVDRKVFPQTREVIVTRASAKNIEVVFGSAEEFEFTDGFFGALVQFPDANGAIQDYRSFIDRAHQKKVWVAVAADILSLVLLTPPGEWGADCVVGSVQRFGLPMGYGGPHAGYFAAAEEFKRYIPGRIIGVSKDRTGKPVLRMALQTREQHIKRERATSNICTAQALLATMAGMYAVYHGPEGLKMIARTVHKHTRALGHALDRLGFPSENSSFFDTLTVKVAEESVRSTIKELSESAGYNLNFFEEGKILISLDQTTREDDVTNLIGVFAQSVGKKALEAVYDEEVAFPSGLIRHSSFMQHPVFHRYRSETELMRYIKKLERRDISLTHSMISLGSCTMKLNAAAELLPLSWANWSGLHPFVPKEQAAGYHQLMEELSEDLLKITQFEGITFQPNSGAAGEYTGLLMIKKYHESRGESHRNVVLIPASAHGTNPASAVMAGMKVMVVPCDEKGNISLPELKKLAEENRENLAAFMVTYPSTHGVFESAIREMCAIIHENGGQVYMDGANMNAQVGLTSPKQIGADVCHLNLHKTFAIPHGGGGPGVGPVVVAGHLREFLPGHPLVKTGGDQASTPVAAAPWGSASILVISHAYIRMMGAEGLKKASQIAILNANYISRKLMDRIPTLYTGEDGYVGHELILDCRPAKQRSGITETDIAKRLMDYGFHAPTLSFPVHGTLMVEPTESESKDELDRFIEAMLQIFREIDEIENGQADPENNVLKNAPHTEEMVVSDEWHYPYGREKAAYPLGWIRENKFWPASARTDDAWGDRHLFCSCDGLDEVYQVE